MPDGAVRDLRNAAIGNAEVSRLDYLISRDNLDPLDAALTRRAASSFHRP
ncbi:hypothetical protein [Burkholderia ubonensis]|nr:hypothetical protein [Burkholderia ubonensis]